MLSATIKRGDSFKPSMTVSNGNVPQNITGWTIASQIRDKDDVLVAALEVFDRHDTLGIYNLRPTVDYPETGWPVGTAYWDIQYTDTNGTIVSTQTITLRIERDVTKP